MLDSRIFEGETAIFCYVRLVLSLIVLALRTICAASATVVALASISWARVSSCASYCAFVGISKKSILSTSCPMISPFSHYGEWVEQLARELCVNTMPRRKPFVKVARVSGSKKISRVRENFFALTSAFSSRGTTPCSPRPRG